MPKKVTPLDATQVKNAKPTDKAYTLSDGQGMQLLITPDGRKSWEFYFISPTQKKRRKTSFGIFPDVTLKQARERREEYRSLLFKGIDPIDAKREVKAVKLQNEESDFENVTKKWFDFQKCNLAKSTYAKKKSLFDNFVNKFFIGRSIASITHDELVKVLELKAIQHPETAERLLYYFNNLWDFALTRKLCNENITKRIIKTHVIPDITKKQYAFITDPIILKELINTIYAYNGHISTKNALKLVLHLPLRAKNLVGLKWSYIDFENKSLTIPRSEMKDAHKRKEIKIDFTLPLTDEAISILKEQYLFTSNREYVFVSDNGQHLNEFTPSMALKRLGFNDEERGRKQRLHSFRGTYKSLAETHTRQHGCNNKAMERVLDHSADKGVEASYTKQSIYFDEMRLLLEWWSGFILDMVEMKR